jgi:hypothetical protein
MWEQPEQDSFYFGKRFAPVFGDCKSGYHNDLINLKERVDPRLKPPENHPKHY